MQVFAFANQKGGVGKTTSCINLAACLAFNQYRILVCDFDPQGNATRGSGVDKLNLKYSVNEVLQETVSLEQAIIKNTPAGYDLLGANSDLTVAEVILVKKQIAPTRFAQLLKNVKDKYDFIFIDCPPSLNMLTVNALVASDAVIIAMQCEYFALEGLTDLVNTTNQLMQSFNPQLQIGGIIRTMYDSRNRLFVEVSTQLIEHFANKVFQTVIPRNVRIAEAPSYGLPIIAYDKHSKGALAYLSLAQEFSRRFAKSKTPAVKNTQVVA